MEAYRQLKKQSGNANADSHRRAVEFFAKKLESEPDNFRFHHNMASLMSKEGNTPASKYHYNKAVLSEPNNFFVRNDYAIELSKIGDKKESVEVMSSALRIQSENGILQNNMGALMARRGDLQEALNHAIRAIQLKPEIPMNHRNLAKIYDARGDTESALKHNKIALSLEEKLNVLHPNVRCYRNTAVQIIERGGDHNLAHELMDKVRRIEGKRYHCPTTDRSNELLIKINKQINEAQYMQREAAEKEKAERLQAIAMLNQSIAASIERPKPVHFNQLKK